MVAVPTRILESDVLERVARLESDVSHIRSDVADLKHDLRDVRSHLSSAMVWALLLYIGLAGGLLYTLARGFKWL